MINEAKMTELTQAEEMAYFRADLSAVYFAILSHAHYDHADGFGDFFRANDHARCSSRSRARKTAGAMPRGRLPA